MNVVFAMHYDMTILLKYAMNNVVSAMGYGSYIEMTIL